MNPSKVQESVITLDRAEVERLLQQQLPPHNLWPDLDGTYYVPEHNMFERVVRKSAVSETQYVAEKYDCEDVSLYFMATTGLHWGLNAVGLALSYQSGHAFNLVLTHRNEDVKVYKFEPQEDDLWRPKDPEKDGHVLENQYVLI